MKKTLLIILLSLIVGIGIANAQTTTNTNYYNWGSIEMRIKISKDNHYLKDTNTMVIVDCISDKLSFNTNSNDFVLILHPNKEYNIVFNREKCIVKSVYINTNSVNYNEKYIINANITMDDTSAHNTKITYNKTKDNFKLIKNYKRKT